MKSLLGPIFTAHLLAQVDGLLIELLESLTPHEWEAQTIAPKWKVKDVAAHLLDTQIRKLSLVRDGYFHDVPEFSSKEEVVALVNRLNQEGVSIYRRISPEVLILLFKTVSPEFARFHESLNPFENAAFAVSWAGEEVSENWFDTARELTERWHHQQQIRLAVNKPAIMIREYYHPVLDTFMRALPYHYRNVDCENGKMAQFVVTGECGGNWYLYRENDNWVLLENGFGEKISETVIPQEIAWRLFTKGIDLESARGKIQCTGNTEVGLHVLSMLSIVG
jgi:uncharacterized protein (TIGR03083 family)